MFVDFVEGPLWIFALLVFLFGVAYRIVSILRLGRKPDLAAARVESAGGLRTIVTRFVPRRGFFRDSVFHLIAGYMFHGGLFVVLLFAAPHIRFIDEELLGVSWQAMPRWAFILSAEVAFAGLIVLWLRRLLDPVLKTISNLDDHFAAGLTFLAMLTGCLALLESFAFLRALHLLSVEVLMVYFPFSRLMHTFTFVLSRGYCGTAYAKRGIRL